MCDRQSIYPLTQRERVAARHLFVCGNSLEIAEKTQTTRRLVDYDLLQLRRKMGEKSSFMAAVKAFHFGLLELSKDEPHG